jgi:hypothetical protein
MLSALLNPIPSSSRPPIPGSASPENMNLLREDLGSLVRRTLENGKKARGLGKRVEELSGILSKLTPLPVRPSESQNKRRRRQISARRNVSYLVRVVPFEGQWCVACGTGHFAWPLEKTAATHQACELAKKMGLSQIAVCDENDLVLDVLNAVLLKKSA